MRRYRLAARLAYSLARQRADFAYHGYVRRDPMALLRLRPGRENPYAIYAGLRRRGPLVPTRLGNFVAVGHDVCNTVLRDRRFGVRSGARVPGVTDEFDMSFLDRDPPDHTRLRRIAQPAFGPKVTEGYRPLITASVDSLLDQVPPGRFDLVPAFAGPLPIAVITALLGVPDADAARFARHGAEIASALDGIRSLRHAARLQAANRELRALFQELFALRRHTPADDVVSRIVAASSADAIQPHEMIPMCNLLLVAGFETTVNLVGNAVNALLNHPRAWRDLCDDPAGLAPAVVEETLRWDPPVQRTSRFAQADVELAGTAIRQGQIVVTLLGAANRDPAVFPDPDRFDIHRPPGADHLAFSSGIHYCIGQPLARLEAVVALQRLAERMPDLRRAGPLRRRSSSVVRGPMSLPVRTTARVTARSR